MLEFSAFDWVICAAWQWPLRGNWPILDFVWWTQGGGICGTRTEILLPAVLAGLFVAGEILAPLRTHFIYDTTDK
jgi:hypothetical protein